MTYVEVAIGIIVRAGQVLVAQRVSGDRFAGNWEFPGGKVLPQESAPECLHREIEEELGVRVSIAGRLAPISYDYGDRRVMLHPFIATITSGEPTALAAEALRWVSIADLQTLSFPEANRTLVAELPFVLRSLSLV